MRMGDDGHAAMGEGMAMYLQLDEPTLRQVAQMTGGEYHHAGTAETLRSEGYTGPVTLVGADESPPYDRPNLSKDFLAGKAPEDYRDPEKFFSRTCFTRALKDHAGMRTLKGTGYFSPRCDRM